MILKLLWLLNDQLDDLGAKQPTWKINITVPYGCPCKEQGVVGQIPTYVLVLRYEVIDILPT